MFKDSFLTAKLMKTSLMALALFTLNLGTVSCAHSQDEDDNVAVSQTSTTPTPPSNQALLSQNLNPQNLAPSPAKPMKSIEASADQAFPLLKKFLSLAPEERNRLNIIYMLKIKHGSLSDVSITLIDNGNSIKLNLDADGRISPLPSLAQLQGGARVKVSGPQGMSSALRLRVLAARPYAQIIDVSTLQAGLNQATKVEHKLAGVLASAAPKLDHVFFSGASSGVVIMADGSTKPLPSVGKTWVYSASTPYFAPAKFPGAIKIRLNALPYRITYDEKPK